MSYWVAEIQHVIWISPGVKPPKRSEIRLVRFVVNMQFKVRRVNAQSQNRYSEFRCQSKLVDPKYPLVNSFWLLALIMLRNLLRILSARKCTLVQDLSGK
jgi:hypothetical protein